MELTINDNNLQNDEINEFTSKVRAILIEDNKILIANYGNIILLPGGKIDDKETKHTAIIRELKEEIGQKYDKKELEFLVTLNYYQKNYPKRDGTLKNRLVQTHYFVGPYKNIKTNSQNLTEKEIKDNFKLELISLKDLKILIEKNNNNPRNIYFQKELKTILNYYKNQN